MFNLFSIKKPLLFIIIIAIILYIIYKQTVKEDFLPWNMGTRFYPSYDLRGYPYGVRGYPLIYPWNYPYPGLPFLYWSPYFYEATGKYSFDPKYAKLLNYSHKRILNT